MKQKDKPLKCVCGHEKIILDACCGGRMIWFDKEHPNAIYTDIREAEKGICKERPNFHVKPDMIADFRNLPFEDKKFKLVVWDPPHMKTLTKTSIMAKKYGVLNAQTYPYDLRKGFDECWRVLEDYGVLIFKWNDNEISQKEVLSFFKEKPLFGHSTGSKSKTRWFCFMKIPEVIEPAIPLSDLRALIHEQIDRTECSPVGYRRSSIVRRYVKELHEDVERKLWELEK